MNQLSLDVFHGVVRPDLSRRQQQVFDALIIGPSTSEGLEKRTGLKEKSITPRILELRKLNLVKKMYEEKNTSGNYANVWGINFEEV